MTSLPSMAPARPAPVSGWWRPAPVQGLALGLALCLTACGGGGSDDTGASGVPGAPGGTTLSPDRAKQGGSNASATPVATPEREPELEEEQQLESLAGLRPPDPTGTEDGRSVGLADYVRDRQAAVRLGKALFWDAKVGSDGSTACASCHAHAGADDRAKNQIFPGLSNLDVVAGHAFNRPARSASWGPNHALRLSDFPLHVLADALDRNSAIVSSTDDGVSSQGVFDATFTRPGQSRFDDCIRQPDGIFHVGNVNVRRVAGRNSPSVVNAALNQRNFWDGRAAETFNGATPFGGADPDAGIWVAGAPGAAAVKVRLALDHASAASQAVGPPGSDFEMSCGGRSFAQIARRILDGPILAGQSIDPRDSVLGASEGGARPKYRELIQAAFQPRLWNSGQPVPIGTVAFSHMEANFPLFFGLAIQLYEATLISDQTPLDAYLRGDAAALGASERRGLRIFAGKGQCIGCHSGPALTSAAMRLTDRSAAQQRIETMSMGDGRTARYDAGFYNIGVRPSAEDVGVGGTDPWGGPLSFTRRQRTEGEVRDAVDGSFKTPGLRNVALTGPYFHNGSRATLEQVVEFYNRGGDNRGSRTVNTSGLGPNPSNLAPDIRPLGLSAQESADLVAFLRNGLTDPRVAWERAPFDHPSLTLPDGHLGDEFRVAGQPHLAARAVDAQRRIPSVGASGRSAVEGPLQPFHAGLSP